MYFDVQNGCAKPGLPRWLSDKKYLPANAGDMGLTPDAGSQHTVEQLSLCTITIEPVLWSLGSHNCGTHMLQLLKL